MSDEKVAPLPSSRTQTRPPEDDRWRRPDTPLMRFLGGSPAGVFVRLFLLSIIVGALLLWLDIRPIDIFHGIGRLAQRVWALGFGAVRELGDYLVAGAVIVVPLWFVYRLLVMRRR